MTTNTTTTTADAGQGVRRPYPGCPFACEREEAAGGKSLATSAAQLGASSSDAAAPLGACSCPDDRCEGYHHEVGEPCGCGQATTVPDAAVPMPTPPACPEWCVLPEGHGYYTHGSEVEGWQRYHRAVGVQGDQDRAGEPVWSVEAVALEERLAGVVTVSGPVVDVQVFAVLDPAGALDLAAAVKRAADAAQAIAGTSGGAWGAPAVVSVVGVR